MAILETSVPPHIKKLLEEAAIRKMLAVVVEHVDREHPGARQAIADRYEQIINRTVAHDDLREPTLAIMREVGQGIAGSPSTGDTSGDG